MASWERLTALGMRNVGLGVKAAPRGPMSLENAPVWGILTLDLPCVQCVPSGLVLGFHLFFFRSFLLLVLTREYAYCAVRTYLCMRIALLTCFDF